MKEHGEDKFKTFIEIYNSGLRLIGAANATGALAAGAAFQAFEKRPEAQSSIKIIIGFFFLGIFAFTISQMALFLLQVYMNNYFRRQNDPSDWEEAILSNGQLRIPIYSGRVFRFEAGRGSDLKPAGIPR